MEANTILFDIETAPAICLVYPNRKNPEQNRIAKIIQEEYIFCLAYQELDENFKPLGNIKVISLHELPYFKTDKKKNYKIFLEKVHALLDNASIVAGQNSQRFDVPMVFTEFIKHGMSPPTPFKQIDTLKISRKYFRFVSNRLGYLGTQLGFGGKEDDGGIENVWDCMNGKIPAWKKLIKYCKHDVWLTVKILIEKFLPWIKQTQPVWNNKKECPDWKGRHTQSRGFEYSREGQFKKYCCLDCGRWWKGEKVINKL